MCPLQQMHLQWTTTRIFIYWVNQFQMIYCAGHPGKRPKNIIVLWGGLSFLNLYRTKIINTYLCKKSRRVLEEFSQWEGLPYFAHKLFLLFPYFPTIFWQLSQCFLSNIVFSAWRLLGVCHHGPISDEDNSLRGEMCWVLATRNGVYVSRGKEDLLNCSLTCSTYFVKWIKSLHCSPCYVLISSWNLSTWLFWTMDMLGSSRSYELTFVTWLSSQSLHAEINCFLFWLTVSIWSLASTVDYSPWFH